MLAYIVKRVLLMVPTLFGILLLTFAVMQFVPGGPVEQLVQELRGRGSAGEVAASDNTYRGRQGVDEAKLKDLTQRHSPGRGLVKPRYNAVIPDLDPLGRPGRIVVEDWQDLPGVPPILR